MSGTCKLKLPFQISIFNYKPASVVTTVNVEKDSRLPTCRWGNLLWKKMAIVFCHEDSRLRLNKLATYLRKKTFLRIRVGYPWVGGQSVAFSNNRWGPSFSTRFIVRTECTRVKDEAVSEFNIITHTISEQQYTLIEQLMFVVGCGRDVDKLYFIYFFLFIE